MKLSACTLAIVGVVCGGMAVQAQDFSTFSSQPTAKSTYRPSSGMLLGVYVEPTDEGLKILGTMSGYSAEGRLFKGDMITQVTAADMPMFRIRSLADIENAKTQIGPFRQAAVEIQRPGTGNLYAWVTFQPTDDGATSGSRPRSTGTPHTTLRPSTTTAPPVVNNFRPSNPNQSSPNQFIVSPNNNTFHQGFVQRPNRPFNPNNNVAQAPLNPNGNPNSFINPSNSVAKSQFEPQNPNNSGVFGANPNQSTPRRRGAEFRLESEQPGASRLFDRRRFGQGGNQGGFGQNNFSQDSFNQNGFGQGGSNQNSFQGGFRQNGSGGFGRRGR